MTGQLVTKGNQSVKGANQKKGLRHAMSKALKAIFMRHKESNNPVSNDMSMSSINFNNQVAFVTGTNKKNGIGRAIVHALLKEGVKKVYATARDANELQDLVAQYRGKVVPVALDVTDLDSIQKLGFRFPDVTLVINNAGYLSGGSGSYLDNDLSKVEQEILVNYVAPLAIVSSFAPLLKKSDQSAVVNINSIASLVNFPVAGTYSASKAATHSLTQAQRRDLPNSLVVGVYPGPIDTAMAEELPFDKTPPSAVADAVMTALKKGEEDVFPDGMANHLFDNWKTDAKILEKEMAKSVEVAQ